MNEIYKRALYNAISPIVIFTPEKVLFKNKAFEELFPSIEVESIRDVMDEEDYLMIVEKLETEGAVEVTGRFPTSIRKSSILIRAYTVLTNQGEKAYFFHMPTFINQDNQMTMLMRHIFDYSKLSVAMTNSHGKILTVNQSFCEWLGYSESELKEFRISDITHPIDLEKERVYFEDVENGTCTSYQMEKRYRRKDGSYVWGESSVSATIIHNINEPSYIGVVKDITERKEMEIKILRKNTELEMLSRFSEQFLENMDISKLIEFVQEELSDHFTLDGLGVYLRDKSDEKLILHSSIGLCHPPVDNTNEISLTGTITGWCLEKHQYCYLKLEDFDCAPTLKEGLYKKGFSHIAFFPIRTSQQVYGVLQFGHIKATPLEEYELKIIHAICNQLAMYFSKMDLFAMAQNEAILRQEAEMDIQYFFQTSVDYLCTASTDGYFKKVSAKFMEELGWSEEELLTKPMTDFVVNRNFSDVDSFSQHLRNCSGNVPFVYCMKCKDGSVKVLEWNVIYVQKRDLIIASARDITAHLDLENELMVKNVELEAAKNKLEENLSYLNTMLDSLEGAICVIDVTGKIVSVNGKLLTRVRTNHQALVGNDVNVLLESFPDFVAAINKGLQEKCATRVSVDYPHLAVDIICTPLVKDTGGTFGVVCLGIDVTERKRLEKDLIRAKERAERADRLKGEFLANLSHEIRTPLHAVIGFSDLLKGNLKDQKSNNYVKAIHASGTILLELINNLLDLSKIEAGMMHLELADTSIINTIEELRVVFESQAVKKGIQFNTKYSGVEGYLFLLDELRIKQVLVNLVSNAIKFTEIGYVEVSVTFDGTSLEICVRDTGIGIPKRDQSTIFNSFTQQSGQSNRKYGGTGLGASISKALVELMGGVIELESEANIGSLFTIRIPNITHKSVKGYATPIACNQVENPFIGAKILVLEEDHLSQVLIQEYLRETQAQLYFVKDGIEAIDSVDEIVPDLVVTDLLLPGMENFEFIRYIKSDPFYKHIPIMCLTSLYGIYSEEQIMDAGFTAYLPKPIQGKELLQTIGNLLKESKINYNSKTPIQHIVPNYKIDARLGEELTVNIINPIHNMGTNIHINGVRKIQSYLFEKAKETGSDFYSYYHRLLGEALLNYDFLEIQKILFQLKVATRKLLHYHLEKTEI